jgi:hypothetical protein
MQSELNDIFLDYWRDYFNTNSLDPVLNGKDMISKRFQSISFDEYLLIAYNVFNGISQDWSKTDGLDKNKFVIVDLTDNEEGETTYSFSPYSIILVPKENSVNAENLYNAGRIICIHRILQAGTYYANGTTAYLQSAEISEIDRFTGEIKYIATIGYENGAPDYTTFDTSFIIYVNELDVISAIEPLF